MGGIAVPFKLKLGDLVNSSTPTWNLVVGSGGDLQNLPLVLTKDPTTVTNLFQAGQWTLENTPTPAVGIDVGSIQTVLWSSRAGKWVRLGNSAPHGLTYSYDGVYWETATNPGPAGTYQVIAESPKLKQFIAMQGGSTVTSSDGITWTDHANALAWDWVACVWVDALNLYVATARSGNPAGTAVATSPDGINWTARNTPFPAANGIAWSDPLGELVAVYTLNGGSGLMTSSDGVNWVAAASYPAGRDWAAVVWGDGAGVFVAIPNDAGEYLGAYSADGSNWTECALANFGGGYKYAGACWSEEMQCFIAVGSGAPNMAYSFDGINWTALNAVLPEPGGGGCAWSPDMGVFLVQDNNTAHVDISAPTSERVNFFDIIAGKATIGGVPLAGDGSTLTATGKLASDNLVAGQAITTFPNPLVSGTVYQNTNAFEVVVYVEATFNPTGAASATLAVALGAGAAPATIFTEDEPAAATAGKVHTTQLVVPPGFYFSFTANAQTTINSTSAFAGQR